MCGGMGRPEHLPRPLLSSAGGILESPALGRWTTQITWDKPVRKFESILRAIFSCHEEAQGSHRLQISVQWLHE